MSGDWHRYQLENFGGSDVSSSGNNTIIENGLNYLVADPEFQAAAQDGSLDYHGAKFDQGKLRHDLVLPEFEDALSAVLTFGAEKYAAHSWMNVPDLEQRYYAALRRHLNAWRKGEKLDPESGLSHLAHAACNIYFLLQNELNEDK